MVVSRALVWGMNRDLVALFVMDCSDIFRSLGVGEARMVVMNVREMAKSRACSEMSVKQRPGFREDLLF